MEPVMRYLESKVMTASKEQLMLMLFDGAIRFSSQAKIKIEEKNYFESCDLLTRAQKIMVELMSGLDREGLGESVYENLMALYEFVRSRLSFGNGRQDPAPIDEALKILVDLRETWSLAMEKDAKERGVELAALPAGPENHSHPSVNLEG
jgi:flagellar protein FliS